MYSILLAACVLTSSAIGGSQQMDTALSDNSSVGEYFKCFKDIHTLDNDVLCRGFISGVVIGGVLLVVGVILLVVCLGVCVYRRCFAAPQTYRRLWQLQTRSTLSYSGSQGSGNGSNETTPLLKQKRTNVRKRWPFSFSSSSGSKGSTSSKPDLASFPAYPDSMVPALVVHCIREIERKGLSSEGLYRKPGSTKTVREVKESLLGVKGQPDLDAVDVNVLCGVLKDFLRNHLSEPLLTFSLRESFVKAAESEGDESLHSSVSQLPPANRETLAYLILHLQRVSAHSEQNKMDGINLATVLGPTIVGHAVAEPEAAAIQTDIPVQINVLQRLIGVDSEYWGQYVTVNNVIESL